MRTFWGKVLAIMSKDILSELRSRDVASAIFVFSLLVIVVFNFALEPGTSKAVSLAAGVLWVSFAFAGVLGFNRTFVQEKEKGCLEGLLLAPVDRGVIYVGKMLGSFLFMLAVEAILLPIFVALYGLPLHLSQQAVILFLATLGFSSVGTLFSALAVNTRAREIMLPLLFLPVVVPVLIAAVKASTLVLMGEGWGPILPWLELIAAFDAIFLTVSFLVFEFVLEE